MKFLIIDFDDTLVETRDLIPYRSNRYGIDFISKYPDRVNSKINDPNFIKLVETFHSKSKVAIATNSSERYVRALLNKHQFPSDLPIWSNLKKPNKATLEYYLQSHDIIPQEAVMIGDSSADILTANLLQIVSIGVTEGYSSEAKLKKAKPTCIAHNFGELYDILKQINKDEIGFEDPKYFEGYDLIDEDSKDIDPEIEFLHLQDYYPYSWGEKSSFYNSGSDKILAFKKAKDFSLEEIKSRASDNYFYNGRICSGYIIQNIIDDFYQQIANMLQREEFSDNTIFYAVPNSNPEYCYRSDVNYNLVKRLNSQLSRINAKRRLHRRLPVQEAHCGGNRAEEKHFQTIGMKEFALNEKIKNVILFDDIGTTGTQIRAVAKIFRDIVGFNENMYGLVLGRTVGHNLNGSDVDDFDFF